jgi:hypothetical protein
MAINLASIAKSLRAEEKALEQRLGKVKKAIAAFVGLDGRSDGRKQSRHSAKSRAAISRAQKARWKKFRAERRQKTVKAEKAA